MRVGPMRVEGTDPNLSDEEKQRVLADLEQTLRPPAAMSHKRMRSPRVFHDQCGEASAGRRAEIAESRRVCHDEHDGVQRIEEASSDSIMDEPWPHQV